MKRTIPSLVLLASFSTLLSCGASLETSGFESLGQVSEATKERLQSAIVGAAELAGLQQLLFGLGVNAPSSLDPIDCADGGSSDTSFLVDMEPLGELSSGDRVRIEYDGCTNGDTTYEGAVVFSISQVIGDTSSTDDWSATATLEVEDLVRATTGLQRVTNGMLTLELQQMDEDLHFSLSGFATTAISDALGTRTRSIDDLEMEWTYSNDTGLTSLVVQAEFRSDAVEGVFTLSTVEPLVGQPFEIPDSGELLLTGANDASLSMVVADGQLVRVRLDTDGDGVIDNVESLLWEDL